MTLPPPSMLHRIAHALALLAVVAFLGACSASRPAGTAPAVPTSKAYHQADAECRHVAVRETENVAPQTQASKAAIAIYWRCMTAKGFPPPNASTVAPAAAPASVAPPSAPPAH